MSIEKILEIEKSDMSELDAITASIGSLVNLLVEKEIITAEEFYDKLHANILTLKTKKESEERK